MNEVYTTELLGLGTTLTELAVKGTATVISNISINVPKTSMATISAENIDETAISLISFFMITNSYGYNYNIRLPTIQHS